MQDNYKKYLILRFVCALTTITFVFSLVCLYITKTSDQPENHFSYTDFCNTMRIENNQLVCNILITDYHDINGKNTYEVSTFYSYDLKNKISSEHLDYEIIDNNAMINLTVTPLADIKIDDFYNQFIDFDNNNVTLNINTPNTRSSFSLNNPYVLKN